MSNATEKQVNYINSLIEKAIGTLEYSANGWGHTAADVSRTFGIGRTFVTKSNTQKATVDALTIQFGEWLNTLARETKEQASATIDTLKNDSLHAGWLNDNADITSLPALETENGKVCYSG